MGVSAFIAALVVTALLSVSCYKTYQVWKNTTLVIPLGLWTIPTSTFFGRLQRSVLNRFMINVTGESKAACDEFVILNEHLKRIGRDLLKPEVSIPKDIDFWSFDFSLYVDLKTINVINKDVDFIYYLGCELDFIKRYMNIHHGMNIPDADFRVLMTEFFYSGLLRDYDTPRIFPAYTKFYRDHSKVIELNYWLEKVESRFNQKDVVATVGSLVNLKDVFKHITQEDLQTACMYGTIFSGWEKNI